MSDRKPCARCSRQIDAYARICPFCNWDQSETPPPREPRPAVQAVAHEPLWRRPWENRALTAAALGALLVIAFVVGSLVHGFEGSEVKPEQARTATAPTNLNPTPPKNVTLVPVSGSEAAAPVIETPITSVPATGNTQGANDTTALPSGQYAAIAERARAQKEAGPQKAKVTDPRALTGAPYQEAQAPREQEAETAAPQRTTAFPEYKPLPRMSFDREMTARLTVTVDAEGRVTDIEVNQPVPQMPKIIAAVQNWRFRPATENGTPVTARVAVDIIFHGNDG